MEVIQTNKPDVVIVDISLNEPAGIELIQSLKAQGSKVPVLVLSMHAGSLYAERVLRAGANGYIAGTECISEVKAAICKAFAGDVYLSPNIASSLLRRVVSPLSDQRISRVALLSDGELQVFRLSARLKIREIAHNLGLSVRAVINRRLRIRRKLDIKNQSHSLITPVYCRGNKQTIEN